MFKKIVCGIEMNHSDFYEKRERGDGRSAMKELGVAWAAALGLDRPVDWTVFRIEAEKKGWLHLISMDQAVFGISVPPRRVRLGYECLELGDEFARGVAFSKLATHLGVADLDRELRYYLV